MELEELENLSKNDFLPFLPPIKQEQLDTAMPEVAPATDQLTITGTSAATAAISSLSTTIGNPCDSAEKRVKMVDNDFLSSDMDNFEDGGEQSLLKKKINQPKKRRMKPRVCSEWSDNDIFKLISCLKCVPMLWNVKDKKYRNKIARRSAWKRISKSNFNGKYKDTELIAKWNNMRIQYRSYFAKYRKIKSGQSANESVKWKFFEAMDFLNHTEEEQSSTTVLSLAKDDEESVESQFDRYSTSSPIVSKRIRPSQPTSPPMAHIVAGGMKDVVEQLKQQQRHEDEYDIFGKFVACELRSLADSNSARRVRYKVARYLMDCIQAESQK